MSQFDAIGVMRKHRWAPISAQRIRLEDDGCERFVDLDATPRSWLFTAIRERTIVKAAYAFLLVERRGLIAGVVDFKEFADKIAKLPRQCHGYVKDLDTGLIGDTPGARKAMLSVVREQLMRSNRGLAAAESAAKRGPKAVELTDLQTAKAEAIWRNVGRFPTWETVEVALQEQVHEDFTRWRGHRMFGPRQSKR